MMQQSIFPSINFLPSDEGEKRTQRGDVSIVFEDRQVYASDVVLVQLDFESGLRDILDHGRALEIGR